jgi:hypothetical protein
VSSRLGMGMIRSWPQTVVCVNLLSYHGLRMRMSFYDRSRVRTQAQLPMRFIRFIVVSYAISELTIVCDTRAATSKNTNTQQ